MTASPSSRPIHPINSFVLPFTNTSISVTSRRFASRAQIAARCGPIFGRCVTTAHAPACVVQSRDRGGQHDGGILALVGGIGVGKHLTDVAEGRRPQQRVGYRMTDGIPIGVTDAMHFRRDIDAAQAHRPALAETMRVVPDADAQRQRLAHAATVACASCASCAVAPPATSE